MGRNELIYRLKKSYSLNDLYTQKMIKNDSAAVGISKSQTITDYPAAYSHEYPDIIVDHETNRMKRTLVSGIISSHNCAVTTTGNTGRSSRKENKSIDNVVNVCNADRLLRSDVNIRKSTDSAIKYASEVKVILARIKFIHIGLFDYREHLKCENKDKKHEIENVFFLKIIFGILLTKYDLNGFYDQKKYVPSFAAAYLNAIHRVNIILLLEFLKSFSHKNQNRRIFESDFKGF